RNTELQSGAYRLLIDGIPTRTFGPQWVNRRLFTGTKDDLEKTGVTGDKTKDPITGWDGYWVEQRDWAAIEAKHPQQLLGITELPIQHACEMVQRHLPFLIGHQEVFELLELNAPGAARQVAQDFPRLTALVLVVRAILSEYGSIAHLEQI